MTPCLCRLALIVGAICWLCGHAVAGPVEPESILEAISWIEH